MFIESVIESRYLVDEPHSEAARKRVEKNIEEIISGGTNKFTYDTVVLKPYARAYLGITTDPEVSLSEHKSTYEEEWREIRQSNHKMLYPEQFLKKPDTFYLLYKDESRNVVKSYEKDFLDEFSGFIDADTEDSEREGNGAGSHFLYLFLQHYMR